MPMDARDIQKLVAKAKDDIIKEVHDRLPRKVGVVAVNHFKQNFRDGGWLDNGLHPWISQAIAATVSHIRRVASPTVSKLCF